MDYNNDQFDTQNTNRVVVNDGNFLYFCIGFCIPIAGLVLYLVWLHERPGDAKMAGVGALVAVILPIAVYVIFLVMGIAFSLGSTF